VSAFSIESTETIRALRNNAKGVFIMIITASSFGAMGFMIKLSYIYEPRLSAGDVLLIRSIIMFPIYYSIAKYSGVDLLNINMYCSKILFLR
jgi:hypothetical protein